MFGKRYPVCSLRSKRNGRHTDPTTEQTAIAGRVSEEFNCLPVENEEFQRISEKRALEALKPKRETKFIDKIPGKILQARNALPNERGAFVVCICRSTRFLSLQLTLYPTADDETRQGPRARKQDHTHAAKRIVGSYLSMFPRVQILAI